MTNADKSIRDRFKAVQNDLSGLREDKATAKKERDAAKEAFGNGEFSADTNILETQEFKDAEEATRKVGEIDDKIAQASQLEVSLLKLLGETQDDSQSPGSAHLSPAGRGWSGHQLLAESEGYAQLRQSGRIHSTDRIGSVSLGEIASRDEAVQFLSGRPSAAALPAAAPGEIGSGIGFVPPDARGIVQPRLLNLSLLDLIPSGTTDSNSVEYVQVTAVPGSAAETAEGALKPEAGLTTQDATAPVRTIAGWLKVLRQALDDVAGLGTLLNTLLPYDVRRRLLAQILAGDGTGQNILGIFNQTGVGDPGHTGGDNAADSILRAMTVVILSDSEPNFVALNPTDWQALLIEKATGSGEYLYGNPGQVPNSMPVQTVWGLPITANRAVPANTPLVGDAMGASILVREGVNVKTSDSDQDDFVKNRVTILAEARVAFPVWRPSAFAIATLS